MQGQTSPEISELLEKISNWRRHYKVAQRIEHTVYYTPPKTGNVINDQILDALTPEAQQAVKDSINRQKSSFNNLPTNMQEAVRMEIIWRSLEDQGKKWYIKWRHIDQIDKSQNGCFILWRRMKQYGIRIRSYPQEDEFNIKCLEYFNKYL